MYSTVRLEAIRDPDLSLEQIQRIMRTIFINHSERLSATKNNPESNRYQGSNRRGRETGRGSAMSTALITCHYCKKPGHEVRDCKKLEKEYEFKNSGKLNHEREKKCCSYHQTNSHLDKQCYQQMRKSKKTKMEVRKNGVACTIAPVIQIKNVFGRRVAVNVRIVLLLMVEIAKNMKPML